MVYTLPIKIKINFYVPLHKDLGGEKYGKNIIFKLGTTQWGKC